MTPIRCFLVRETNRARIILRRYHSLYKEGVSCPVNGTAHEASVVIDVRDTLRDADGNYETLSTPQDDPSWPTHCDCGYAFVPEDVWQTNQHELYQVAEGSEAPPTGPWEHRELPVGAMYYPSWMQPGPDYVPSGTSYYCATHGSVLCVITPDNPDGTGRNEWIIDSYCSNCDRKGQPHHCWCRHNDPPNVTVNKTPPDELGTCGAGAGSIWSRMPQGWHGFLQNGFLTQA